jgi:hypothetical protein
MQIIRDDKFIARRANIGRYVSLAGLVILLIGLVISFTHVELYLLSYLTLIIGFIFSQVGIYFGNRYSRADRPDAALSKALKGFDDRYLLYQYTTPVANVLLTPNNCLVFTVKMQAGPIEYRDNRWYHHIGWRRVVRWMTQEGLGNPTREALYEAQSLQRYLSKKLPETEVPIQPVIVFGNPDAEVEATTSPIPAMHAKKLKDWLRGPGKSGNLMPEARQHLIDLFDHHQA